MLEQNFQLEEYYIYGMNRVAKDFMYVFNKINIIGIFDDVCCEERFGNVPVIVDMERTLKSKKHKIIICDFNKEYKEQRCKDFGLLYGQDYFYEEDFFELLNTKFELPSDKKIVMWGIGKKGEKTYESYLKGKIEFCIDVYSSKTEFKNVPVKRPEEICNWNDLFIIVTPQDNHMIIKILQSNGLYEGENYILANRLTYDCVSLLKQTIFDKSCYDLHCKTILNHFEILMGGDTRTCCTTFLEQGIGNIEKMPIDSVWGNVVHRILALSVENQTYTFCKKDMCPYFIGKKNNNNINLTKEYDKIQDRPSVVAIGYDATCNLKCETCRKKIYVAQGEEKEKLCQLSRRLNNEIISKCKFLIMAGNGEVFSSDSYKAIYTDEAIKKPKFIRILSNGTLFNEKNWQMFKKGKSSRVMATFSIDAATKESYEAIRRGGDFDVVKRNMEFASYLRKKCELSYFRLNFVVQKRNYLEMEQFVRWGKELDADEVFFTKILNWGTFTEEQFKEVSMFEDDGVTPKTELVVELQKPIMKDKIVDLGTIQYAHKEVEGKDFYNYYMWELQRKVPNLFNVD